VAEEVPAVASPGSGAARITQSGWENPFKFEVEVQT